MLATKKKEDKVEVQENSPSLVYNQLPTKSRPLPQHARTIFPVCRGMVNYPINYHIKSLGALGFFYVSGRDE